MLWKVEFEFDVFSRSNSSYILVQKYHRSDTVPYCSLQGGLNICSILDDQLLKAVPGFTGFSTCKLSLGKHFLSCSFVGSHVVLREFEGHSWQYLGSLTGNQFCDVVLLGPFNVWDC